MRFVPAPKGYAWGMWFTRAKGVNMRIAHNARIALCVAFMLTLAG